MRNPDVFCEVLNGKIVNPLDRSLSLPQTLRMLYDLQRQEDRGGATTNWQITGNPIDAYQTCLRNGVLERVYAASAGTLLTQTVGYDIRRRVAGRLFGEIAYGIQKAKLDPKLTLLSTPRTVAFYNKLLPNSYIYSLDGYDLAGLLSVPEEGAEAESEDDKKLGIKIPDALALRDSGSTGLVVDEIHEHSTSWRTGRTFRKFEAYREAHSPLHPDILSPEAIFVFVTLGGSNTSGAIRKIRNRVSNHLPGAHFRGEKIEMDPMSFRELVSLVMEDYAPNPEAKSLQQLQVVRDRESTS